MAAHDQNRLRNTDMIDSELEDLSEFKIKTSPVKAKK